MLSKLWATYEMNFWERKVHGAFKCNLTFLTWQIRGLARHKLILQQMFQPKYVKFKKSQVPQWYIDVLYTLGLKFHAIFSAVNEELLSWPSSALFELASPRQCKHLGQFKFLSRNSKVFKIYTKYLCFLVYNQVYNLFICTSCPCLNSFLQSWNWDKLQQNSRSLDMSRVTYWKSRFRLDCVT